MLSVADENGDDGRRSVSDNSDKLEEEEGHNVRRTVVNWTISDCLIWTEKWVDDVNDDTIAIRRFIANQRIDGKALLLITSRDLERADYDLTLGAQKRLLLAIRELQRENYASLVYLGFVVDTTTGNHHHSQQQHQHHNHHHPASILDHNHNHLQHHPLLSPYQSQLLNSSSVGNNGGGSGGSGTGSAGGDVSPPSSVDGRSTSIQPEVFKTFISLGALRDKDINYVLLHTGGSWSRWSVIHVC